MSALGHIQRRIFVGIMALVVALVGILPLVDAYRCASMGSRLTSHSCCAAEHESERETTISGTCCERIPARAMEARAQSSAPELRIAPAPLAGLLEFPSVSTHLAATLMIAAAHPEGRPPGERLHLLSSVLRV